MQPSPPANPLRRARAPLGVLAGLMAMTLVGIIAGGVADSARGPRNLDDPSPAAAMIEVAPGGVIDPSDVPEKVAVLYLGAHAHADVYEQIPCFCGCEAMLGHRHLLDCFARPDGSWEAHATGCGVCLGEATQVEGLLAAGETDPTVIRTAVVAEWGDPYQSK